MPPTTTAPSAESPAPADTTAPTPKPVPLTGPTFTRFEALVAQREKAMQRMAAQVGQIGPLMSQVKSLTEANAGLSAQIVDLKAQVAALQNEVTALEASANDAAAVQAKMEAVLSDPANAQLVAEADAALAASAPNK